MSMWSDRKEFYEEKERQARLRSLGEHLRSHPEFSKERQASEQTMKKMGVNINDAYDESSAKRLRYEW